MATTKIEITEEYLDALAAVTERILSSTDDGFAVKNAYDHFEAARDHRAHLAHLYAEAVHAYDEAVYKAYTEGVAAAPIEKAVTALSSYKEAAQ